MNHHQQTDHAATAFDADAGAAAGASSRSLQAAAEADNPSAIEAAIQSPRNGGDFGSKGFSLGRHRVFQTLLVLSLTLLHQKASAAIAASSATPSSPTSATAAASSSDGPAGKSERMVANLQEEGDDDDDDLLVTTHEDDDEFVCDEEEVEELDTNGESDILIVSTADGSLMGLSKSTGALVWEQSGHKTSADFSQLNNGFASRPNNGGKKDTVSDAPQLSLLEPLVATSTTSQSFASRDWRTAAVPSLDGKTVYLTAHVAPGTGGDTADNGENRSPEITVTTSIPDLVHRAPFVDNRGRIYNGSRSSVAVAVDGNTGEILKVISTSGEFSSPNMFQGDIEEEEEEDDGGGWDGTSGPRQRNQQKKKKRKVVWMGRVDHSISVHEPQSGNLDVQFSAAEIKSVRDMILGQTIPEEQPPWEASPGDAAAAQLFLSASNGGPVPTQSAPTPDSPNSLWKAVTSTPPSEAETCLVATPNGNLAYRNPATGNIDWVSPVRFEAPVAFALDANSGASLPVDIVPDAPVASNDSSDYLTREIHRQYNNLLADATTAARLPPSAAASKKPDPLVGTLAKTGQLFAMPLGDSLHLRQRRHALLSAASSGAMTASSPHTRPSHKGSHVLSSVVPLIGRHHGDLGRMMQNQRPSSRRLCFPGNSNFPACLVSPSTHIAAIADKVFGKKTEATENALVPFDADSDGDSVDSDLPPPVSQAPPSRKYQKLLRILGSWLPPTLAMIFVVSFELGRRKRQKDQNKADEGMVPGTEHASGNNGVIQVNQNVILGYGGHGTVVFEGSLEGRKVAVKRMLQAYHASADREISLLIESDGHPNVVRYFLKEVRGDFVYLALELCDLSLHELIGHMGAAYELMQKENWFEKDNLAIPNAVRTVLLQIAGGVKHLHQLRIVHRDLKPANILLADSRKSKRKGDMLESVFEIFSQGDYVAKISDMGLGKQLVGHSSFGGAGESSLRAANNENGQSSLVGAGPGTVGWQAPEVMIMRMPASDTSVRSDGSANAGAGGAPSGSNPDSASDAATRTSRSADIFSLGCIFYTTLVPGSHPFGEWYEREANIMHNRPDLDALKEISTEAFDLVSWMVKRNPAMRPTAKQVCDHPYFWSPERRLLFLCDFSDRLETEGLGNNGDFAVGPSSDYTRVIAIERNASGVVGSAWDTALDDDLVSNVQRFRTYDPSSVRDLLRLIRNKYHHFEELPDHLKDAIGSKTEGLSTYFERRFPALLIHCFNVGREILPSNDPLSVKYSIPAVSRLKSLDLATTSIAEVTTTPESPPPPSAQGTGETLEETELEDRSSCEQPEADNQGLPAQTDGAEVAGSEAACEPDDEPDACPNIVGTMQVSTSDAGDVVVWECSTAAKTFNNRGWFRSDDDWVRRTDASLRKPNSVLIRCMDDPKFRTRLCNHWDASHGTFCPMKKKGKCVFAHGPVELRVKEGKRNRWGKLVDKSGDNKNPKHSGGEDTYGAARSIETERKQEGKWNVDNKGQSKGRKGAKKKEQPTAEKTKAADS